MGFTSVLDRVRGCGMPRSKVRPYSGPLLVNADGLCCIENILFNLPYVEERYRKTLEVCALDNDLKILEDGDESEIGERGVGTMPLISIIPESTLNLPQGQSVGWTESSWYVPIISRKTAGP
jgi:hypothetical protein